MLDKLQTKSSEQNSNAQQHNNSKLNNVALWNVTDYELVGKYIMGKVFFICSFNCALLLPERTLCMYTYAISYKVSLFSR